MPKIRATSRYISKYVHKCNDKASTRFLAASEANGTCENHSNRGAAPAGKRILDSARSQTTVYGRSPPPSHSLAVQQTKEVDLGYLDVQLNSLSESTPLSLYYITPSFPFHQDIFYPFYVLDLDRTYVRSNDQPLIRGDRSPRRRYLKFVVAASSDPCRIWSTDIPHDLPSSSSIFCGIDDYCLPQV
jgi:hypothetical protein